MSSASLPLQFAGGVLHRRVPAPMASLRRVRRLRRCAWLVLVARRCVPFARSFVTWQCQIPNRDCGCDADWGLLSLVWESSYKHRYCTPETGSFRNGTTPWTILSYPILPRLLGDLFSGILNNPNEGRRANFENGALLSHRFHTTPFLVWRHLRPMDVSRRSQEPVRSTCR
jgi:hypothetical protein